MASRQPIENHCVYLLHNADASGKCYCGYSPRVFDRVRTHNRGILAGGAIYTTRHGPGAWRIGMVVANFPTREEALSFESAIQHPKRSIHLRDTFSTQWAELRLTDPKAKSYNTFLNRVARRDYKTWRSNMISLYHYWRKKKLPSGETMGQLRIFEEGARSAPRPSPPPLTAAEAHEDFERAGESIFGRLWNVVDAVCDDDRTEPNTPE